MDEVIPSRRVVLRGALAAGCGLWLPIALFGCDSKTDTDATSSAPATPAANKKMAQVDVQYQTQSENQQKCGGCLHFIAESNTCMVVDGQISAEGRCSLWTKKS